MPEYKLTSTVIRLSYRQRSMTHYIEPSSPRVIEWLKVDTESDDYIFFTRDEALDLKNFLDSLKNNFVHNWTGLMILPFHAGG
jgi:hypothetical protein